MSKFKVGDEVTLKEDISSIYLKYNKEYVVDKVFDDKLFVQGVDFKYDSKIFELVKESNMNKFKVGDKVVRVSETYGKAIKGGVYEVIGVSDKGCLGNYSINLKGHEGVSGKFNYEASCFELYMGDVLSPLEAAEALLKGDELEVIISKSEEWQPLDKHQNSVTIKNLKRWKFRHKPETVIINGVEVVAPTDENSIGHKFYVVDVPAEKVHEVYSKYVEHFKHYWATEEDAQKALGAMLLPFDKLNKGDK